MTNQDIAKKLEFTATLLELYGENPFKIKAYNNAVWQIEKFPLDISLALETGKAYELKDFTDSTLTKIKEICSTGTLKQLEDLIAKTPPDVIKMLNIKGLGPKKVSIIYGQMGITTLADLIYACNENRLIEVKGFGAKTQASIQKALDFYLNNQGKSHYSKAFEAAQNMISLLKKSKLVNKIEITGNIRRKNIVIDEIEFLAECSDINSLIDYLNLSEIIVNQVDGNFLNGKTPEKLLFSIEFISNQDFTKRQIQRTNIGSHLEILQSEIENHTSEEAVYQAVKLPFIAPEFRDNDKSLELAKNGTLSNILEIKDLNGIFHAHSTWSDGAHSIEDMAKECIKLGYKYLGITDHSQSAFYANGLSEGRLEAQFLEIDKLNEKYPNFKIFKGIESDILFNGNLDYPENTLKKFDFVIASIHSTLKMNEVKATERLINAISNPFTTMLGHPTGRLLLMREGYPIDHKAVIDACAQFGVIIELNANPYRLDLDYQWIEYAISKNVKISINPDAHRKEGIQDVVWGTEAARKGLLTKEMTFNTLSLEEIIGFFEERKRN